MRIVTIALAVTLVAANPIGNAKEKFARQRRDTSDFHSDFIREERELVAMKQECAYNEFLDLNVLTCRECERFCADDKCGQCGEYFLDKKATGARQDMLLNDQRRDNRETGQWICIAVLFIWVIGATTLLVRLRQQQQAASEKPYVTIDTIPHCLDQQDLTAEQPEMETYRGIVQANRDVAQKDTTNSQIVQEENNLHPNPVCQPDQDYNCETLVA